MLELHIPNTTVQTGVAPVSWCVDRQTLEDLARRGIPDPYVLIVVAPEEHYGSVREVRKIVPLKDLMTYVEFRTPGPNRVFAVVCGANEKWMRHVFLSRNYGDWGTTVLNSNGDEVRADMGERIGAEFVAASAPIRVEVPGECFAAKPFDAGWVNLMLPGRPENQCEFRRRRLFAYTVQPVIAGIIYLIRLIAALFLLLIGRRGVDLRPLTRPFQYETEDVWRDVYGSYMVPRRGENPLRYAGLAFTPAVILAALAINALTQRGLMTAVLGTAVTVAGIFAVLIGGILCQRAGAKWREEHELQMHRTPKLAEGETPWYLRQDASNELVCAPGRGARAGVGDVPRRLRTLRLRFEGLKSKVCRPFAR